MFIEGWKYYNHAAIPTCAPHELPNLSPIKDGSIENLGGGTPLLARWTTDWECGYETGWWYVIKDSLFDINELKSKRRYEINKGNKNFKFCIINPEEFVEAIYTVTVAAYSGWSEKYRPRVTKESITNSVKTWTDFLVFGAFSLNDDMLQGFALVKDYGSYADFAVLRTNPEKESLGINAALIDSILSFFNERLHDGFYICDGARSVRHETAFQDYLEKYFQFRKAYCKLNIEYKRGIGLAIKLLFPFRKLIRGRSRVGSQISALLKMEEIKRNNKE